MATAWIDPSCESEHIVMARRSAKNASISSGVIAIALRWFTPWPMA
jgi:hypothetical protein